MVTSSLKAKRLAHIALYIGSTSTILIIIATSTEYWYVTSKSHGGIYTQYKETIATYVDLPERMEVNGTVGGIIENFSWLCRLPWNCKILADKSGICRSAKIHCNRSAKDKNFVIDELDYIDITRLRCILFHIYCTYGDVYNIHLFQ